MHAQTTQPLAIFADTVYTVSSGSISNGLVLTDAGKISYIGPAIDIDAKRKTLRCKVLTPGLIDAHTIVGLQGYRNEPREQDQLEKSAPIQPELRALDAYNAREKLVEYLRGFGITTIQTGPQPGALVPGQLMIIKTIGTTVDEGLLNPSSMLSITLGENGLGDGGKSPGTRPKEIAMLRAELLKAQDYAKKQAAATQPATAPARDLHEETLARVVTGKLPVLITANRAQDILLALKLAKEFDLNLVLDSAAEAYLLIDQIKAANVPIILHPTMKRTYGELENLSFETAGKLHAAGIRIALQSGYEDYVPKTRIVLFEASVAAANGLKFDDALSSITLDAARILGIDARVGSIQIGKDADLAMFDGDPFEYTSHCIGTVIDGDVKTEAGSSR